jgi:hypothetical protein
MDKEDIAGSPRHVYTKISGAEIGTSITTEDFQNYWKRVDERISSLFSGVTFSH